MNTEIWHLLVQSKGTLSKSEFGAATRFKARFEFASNLRAFEIDGFSSLTANAYFAFTKLGLAYSAVEAFQRLVGKGWQLKLREPAISFAIENGELQALVKHLVRAAEGHQYGKPDEVRPYLGGSYVEDLLPLVAHSRHVMFHGSVTPGTVKLATKRRQELILDLADETLAMTASEFEKWLKKRISAR